MIVQMSSFNLYCNPHNALELLKFSSDIKESMHVAIYDSSLPRKTYGILLIVTYSSIFSWMLLFSQTPCPSLFYQRTLAQPYECASDTSSIFLAKKELFHLSHYSSHFTFFWPCNMEGISPLVKTPPQPVKYNCLSSAFNKKVLCECFLNLFISHPVGLCL